jgi:hypothetical protein
VNNGGARHPVIFGQPTYENWWPDRAHRVRDLMTDLAHRAGASRERGGYLVLRRTGCSAPYSWEA